MPRDRAGNTLRSARRINLTPSNSLYQDFVGDKDPRDLYQVKLSDRSSFNASLIGLSTKVSLALLNDRGRVIQRINRKQAPALQRTMEAGTYYLQVQRQKGNTRYRLNLAATALKSSSPSLVTTPVEPSPFPTTPTNGSSTNPGNPSSNSSPNNSSATGTFKIQFDYRFDTKGWFTSARKAALESAARIWEGIIQDEFADVPVGTEISVIHPETGEELEGFRLDRPIDDVLIFVGARSIDGTGNLFADTQPSGLTDALDGQADYVERYEGDQFKPWAASMSFDNAEAWFFDATPMTANDIPAGKYDFLAIALQEIGRALGIGFSDAFDNLTVNETFTGTKAKAQNNGAAIPLTPEGYIQDGFIASAIGTEALMDPIVAIGTRKLPTNLDIALLEDLGYQVNYRS
jgi:hypothetical protein